ncbi:MAG: serine hydroxymethyltransferase, partial [Myxococcota bacterium]
EKPRVTSGLRIGTPAVTSRGMKESQMNLIAEFVHRVLRNPGDVEELGRVRSDVEGLCREFPLYPQRWSEPV